MILKGTGATVKATVYVDGTPTALTSNGTVVVTDEAGNEIASGNASSGGTGIVTFTLTPTHTADVNRLTITWSGLQFSGGAEFELVTYEEVVGELLFTEAEARAFDEEALSAARGFSDQDIADIRTTIHDQFEEILGYPIGWRYERQVLDGLGSPVIPTTRPYIRAVRSVGYRATRGSSTWTTLTAAQLLQVVFNDWKQPEWEGGSFPPGTQNLRIEYEAGRPIPGVLRRAALQVAREWLTGTNVPQRALFHVNPEGGQYRLAVAEAKRDHWFGLPEVDSALQELKGGMPV